MASTRSLSTILKQNPQHLPSQAPLLRVNNLTSRHLNHSATHQSTPPNSKPKTSSSSSSSLSIRDHPSFLLWQQIAASRPAVRYTIYAGFALLATAETTFWCNVIYAKWFAGEEDRERADALIERVIEAVKGYRLRWLIHYGNYYGANIWGL